MSQYFSLGLSFLILYLKTFVISHSLLILIAAGTYLIRGVPNVAGWQGWTGSNNRPWTLIQTGPPELAVHANTAALLMHAHVFDDTSSGVRYQFFGLYLSAK